MGRSIVTLLLVLLVSAASVEPLMAAEPTWQRGFVLWSPHVGYGTPDVFPALRSLRAAGASHVMLVVTWYVDGPWASYLGEGPDTPSDEDLRSVVNEAHRQNLRVVLVLHVNCRDGSWRAMIDPKDTQAWFDRYAGIVAHYARLSGEWGIDGMVVGAELIKLSGPRHTEQWRRIIRIARQRFNGFLTYSANWGSNAPPGQPDPLEEYSSIQFWPDLDYIGISGYFELHDPSANRTAYLASWADWKRRKIEPLYQRLGKPVLFTEVGYRSISGAAAHPWDYGGWGSPDQRVQADLYSALIEYWSRVRWVAGVYFWHWSIERGGEAPTDYPPQGKLAEEVIRYWFRRLAASTYLPSINGR